MKRFACLCGGLAVLVAAQSATAQVTTSNNGLSVWYDVRPTVAEITTPPANTPANRPFTFGQSCVQLLVGKNNVVDNVAAGNAGGPGDAQVLRISPRLRLDPGPLPTGFGLHVTGKKSFVDNSVKNIYAYISVDANGAGADQVISALGRDTDIVKQGLGTTAAGNNIESIAVTPDAGPWSVGGTAASAAAAGPDWALTAKSVKIPVAVGPLYNATGGAIPVGVYRVACITVTAGVWNKPIGSIGGTNPGNSHVANSTYLGNDKVNNLLMTRAVSSGGPAPAELLDFGYTTVNVGDVEGNICNMPDPFAALPARADFVTGSNGGSPEASNLNAANPGLFSGIDIGASSIEADFEIVVQMKGDYNHDGLVNAADTPARNQAILASTALTIRQREAYLGDFTNEGTVDAFDIPAFNKNIIASGGDCSNPADCPPAPCGGFGEPACPSCPAP